MNLVTAIPAVLERQPFSPLCWLMGALLWPLELTVCYCSSRESMQSASFPEALALYGLLSTLYSVLVLFLLSVCC